VTNHIEVNDKESADTILSSSSMSSRTARLFNPNFGKYDTLIKYTLVPLIPLSVIAILCINPNTWVSSAIHHFYIELFAVLLAAILSFYYLARSKTLNDKFSLFIGIGFLVNALIDLLHVVISITYMNEFLFLKYFIPQTWFAGRIFLGAMFAIAIAEYPKLSSIGSSDTATNSDTCSLLTHQQQQQRKESKERERKIPQFLIGYLAALIIVCTYIALSSLFIVYPGTVVDDFSIHRLYEIPALAVYSSFSLFL
jgi:hypothetical protein